MSMVKRRVVIVQIMKIRLIQFLGALLHKKGYLTDNMDTSIMKNQMINHVTTLKST
jgi:hypothetical protein